LVFGYGDKILIREGIYICVFFVYWVDGCWGVDILKEGDRWWVYFFIIDGENIFGILVYSIFV
jgi:hypothetical protein